MEFFLTETSTILSPPPPHVVPHIQQQLLLLTTTPTPTPAISTSQFSFLQIYLLVKLGSLFIDIVGATFLVFYIYIFGSKTSDDDDNSLLSTV